MLSHTNIKELKKQKNESNALFGNFTSGIIQLDREGNILKANKAFKDLFKYEESELINNHIDSIMFDKDSNNIQLASMLTERALEGNCFRQEMIRYDRYGNPLEVKVQSLPIYTDKELTSIYIIYEDISEQKAYELNMKKSYDKLIKALGSIVEIKDPYTYNHQIRVARVAEKICQALKLSDKKTDIIKRSAYLHDLGKFKVPIDLLIKPTALEDEEFEVIKMHPITCYEIFEKIDFTGKIPEVILQHHEKLDGSGYPYGLNTEDIYLESRVLTVADIIEAISSHRPYRPALGINKAITVISEEAEANKLDKEIVSVATNLLKNDNDLIKLLNTNSLDYS